MRARRWWGWGLVPLYAVGLAVKDGVRAFLGPQALGVLRVRRLEWPVVSVGSLSAGGAGKTPVVIALAELLQARGWEVDVLSRGYGRSGRGVERVDVSVEDAAGRFGDEPVLIGRRAGVGVWVGGDRFAAGVMAERGWRAEEEAGSSTLLRNDGQEGGREQGHPQRQKQIPFGDDKQKNRQGQEQGQKRNAGVLRFARNDTNVGGRDFAQNDTSGGDDDVRLGKQRQRVHLLDDGFQHRGLGRAVDVVLVTAADLEDALLPAGNRREPLRALRRADVVVVREEEFAGVEGRVRGLMREDARVWVVRRELVFSGDGESESQRTRSGREDAEGLGAGLDLFADVGVHTPGAKAPMSSGAGERPEAEASGYLEAKAEAGIQIEPGIESELGAVTWVGGRVVGFCAIARPEGFWGMLGAAGVEVVGRVEFGDHHRYGMVDVERVLTVARECGAAGFVTTEKDAVKLTAEMRRMLAAVGPVVIARLDVRFLDEAAVMRDVESKIGEERIG